MKINIIGDGSFGLFLKKELPNYGFEIVPDDFTSPIILAIPFSAYEKEVSKRVDKYPNLYVINVCSVQKPSTDILLKYTDKVTSIHPLFGVRTPVDKRNSILTYEHSNPEMGGKENLNAKIEIKFLSKWSKFSKIRCCDYNKKPFNPESHDQLMAKTHASAVLAAKQAKHFVDAAEDIPDELIPNSFRLLKEFVKTLEDMPSGTIESIMANPYI